MPNIMDSLFGQDTSVVTDPHSQMIGDEMQNYLQGLQEQAMAGPSQGLQDYISGALGGTLFDKPGGYSRPEMMDYYGGLESGFRDEYADIGNLLSGKMPSTDPRFAETLTGRRRKGFEEDMYGMEQDILMKGALQDINLAGWKRSQDIGQMQNAYQMAQAYDPQQLYQQLLSSQQVTPHIVQDPSFMQQIGQMAPVASLFVGG